MKPKTTKKLRWTKPSQFFDFFPYEATRMGLYCIDDRVYCSTCHVLLIYVDHFDFFKKQLPTKYKITYLTSILESAKFALSHMTEPETSSECIAQLAKGTFHDQLRLLLVHPSCPIAVIDFYARVYWPTNNMGGAEILAAILTNPVLPLLLLENLALKGIRQLLALQQLKNRKDTDGDWFSFLNNTQRTPTWTENLLREFGLE